MHFSWQDLNKGNERKHYKWNGRCWWNHGEFLHLEWCLFGWSGLRLELWLNHYGETAIQIAISALFFKLYVGTDNRKIYKFLEPITKRKGQKYTNGRIVGFSFSDATLTVDLWDDPMESRSVDPKWWSFRIDFADLIFGRKKHVLEILKTGNAEIDMPEGKYPCTYKVERRTWKRPRWFAKTSTAIWFDIPAGIPHEGKSENSYDCDMDATFGIGTHWNENIYEAAKRIATRCLESRARYGSLSSPAYAKWRTERMSYPTEKA